MSDCRKVLLLFGESIIIKILYLNAYNTNHRSKYKKLEITAASIASCRHGQCQQINLLVNCEEKIRIQTRTINALK